MKKLWQSGIFLAAANLLAGLLNFYFQRVIGTQLDKPEYGYVNNALGLIGFLILPMTAVGNALTHHLAHYRGKKDEERLKGLIIGSQHFLLRFTVLGSIVALLLIIPLGHYFNLPRYTLTLAAIVAVLATLWSNYSGAFCAGMGWFGRWAMVSWFVAIFQVIFASILTRIYSLAEAAVYSTALSATANLFLLIWYKEIFLKSTGPEISPWNRDFAKYLIIALASAIGTYMFISSDILVAARHFEKSINGSYQAAGRLARALVYFSNPLLTVLFTSRSENLHQRGSKNQKILVAIYILALGGGVSTIILFRDFFTSLIFNQSDPQSAKLVVELSIIMVLVAFIQGIGLWALASRWYGIVYLHAFLGVVYWLVCLYVGRTPEVLLNTMLILAATALIIMIITAINFRKKRLKLIEANT